MRDNETIMYLLRHGATANNEAGVLQGRGVDHSLSSSGRAQIVQASRHLSERALDAIYCSPLRRAWESAEILAAHYGLKVEVEDGLVEVDVGRWEGRSWAEIAEIDAATLAAFSNDEGRCAYPDGESYAHVAQRVEPVFTALLNRHAGRQFGVVAHSVVNRVYLAQLLGMSPDQARRIHQTNGCINVVRRYNGKTRAATINAAIHVD